MGGVKRTDEENGEEDYSMFYVRRQSPMQKPVGIEGTKGQRRRLETKLRATGEV